MKDHMEIIAQIRKEYEKIGSPINYEPSNYGQFKYGSEMERQVDKILELLNQLAETSVGEELYVKSAIKALSYTRNKEVRSLETFRSKIRPNKPKIRETEFREAWEEAKSQINNDIYSVLHHHVE